VGGLPGSHLRVAESEEQLATLPLRPASGFELVEAQLVETHSFLVREQRERVIAGTPRVEHRALDVTAVDRMVRELCKGWPGRLAIESLERFECPPMQLDTPSLRQPLVERVSDQDVRETQPVDAARHLGDDAGGRSFIERVEQGVFRRLVQTCKRCRREL